MRKRIEKDDIRRSESTRKFSGPSSGGSSARKPTKNFTDRSTGNKPTSDRGGRSEFRSSEPKSFEGPKREFSGDRERKPYNPERKPYAGDRPSRPYQGGDSNSESPSRREFDGPKREFSGDRERKPYNKPYSSDRTPNSGERNRESRPYQRGDSNSENRPRRDFDGPKREFSGDRARKPYNKPYSSDRTPNSGERNRESRPYQGGDSNSESRPRREFDGPKREFSGDRARKPFNPERKPYAGDRPNRAFQVGELNSESQPPREFDGPKKEFSGDREHKPFQADGSETERPKRVFDRDKSDDSSKDFREAPTSKFSKRDTFKSRNRYEESPAHTPQYKLDRFKEKAPAKIQRRIREAESKSDMVRLNRYIANAGICSRRDADKLIEAGEIKVNNKVITEMGYQVAPTDIVKYGNRKLNREKPVYVLLNKPKDFLTTTEDPNDRKTVMELVKNAGDARIYPVGRLDRNTTGLILLSNDGELADRLTHPSHEIEKIYQAELDKPLTDDDFEKIKAGLTLEDGEIKVDDLAKVTPDGYVIGVKIHSGKNRIVRRIFEHLGYEVTKLDRTTFAGLTKKDLPRGHWRYLTERELVKLKYFM
jgi:23S rRNA pseudouridine2605 synthase